MLRSAGAAGENDQEIADGLAARDQSDSVLAASLFENWKNSYYRVLGFRSTAEYLRERFAGTEQDAAARGCARTHARLIREYKLATEIPLFKEYFDKISRTNRRLIAQVLEPEAAKDLSTAIWIHLALDLNCRELESFIQAYKAAPNAPASPNKLVSKTIKMFPAQLEIFNEAMERATVMSGTDPGGPEHEPFEMIMAEFIAAYGASARPFFVTECPACQELASMKRTEVFDLPDAGGRVVVVTCQRCHKDIIMRALNASEQHSNGKAQVEDQDAGV